MCRISISQREAIERKPFSKGVGFLPNRELCAANKYTRRIDGYRYYQKRKKPRASPKCPFCPKFRRIKLKYRKKDKEIKYGKIDSCSGDSGGPLWKWMGKKGDQKATVPTKWLYFVPNTQETSHFY